MVYLPGGLVVVVGGGGGGGGGFLCCCCLAFLLFISFPPCSPPCSVLFSPMFCLFVVTWVSSSFGFLL